MKKYISTPMDQTLKIEANGDSCEKILEVAIFDCKDFGKDPIMNPFSSQTKLLKSQFKKMNNLLFLSYKPYSHIF